MTVTEMGNSKGWIALIFDAHPSPSTVKSIAGILPATPAAPRPEGKPHLPAPVRYLPFVLIVIGFCLYAAFELEKLG